MTTLSLLTCCLHSLLRSCATVSSQCFVNEMRESGDLSRSKHMNQNMDLVVRYFIDLEGEA